MWDASVRGRVRWLGLIALALAALVAAGVRLAPAATLEVCPSGCAFTTIADALAAAANGDTIKIASGSYAGGFQITKNVELRGAGAAQTTIIGGGPVVGVAPGVTATIRGVTITGGSNAGVRSDGTLTLIESTVSGNTSNTSFGGIASFGTLTLRGSMVIGNTALSDGGGIANFGTLTLRESTISGNTSLAAKGGGIFQGGGTATLIDGAISGNTAVDGGGIFRDAGTLTLRNTTLINNTPNDCVGC